MGTSAIVTLVIIAVLLFYVVGIFNRLVALKNRFENAFAQIERPSTTSRPFCSPFVFSQLLSLLI